MDPKEKIAMKEKTVKDAAKKLSKKTRRLFLKAWKATNRMDLYDGNLEAYLLIGDIFQQWRAEIYNLEKAIKEVKEVLSTMAE